MPLTSLEEGRALVDDLQGAVAEDLDDLAGVVRADALDQAGAEVLLDALDGVRRRVRSSSALNCRPWSRSWTQAPVGLDVLAGDDAGEVADDGDDAAAGRGWTRSTAKPVSGFGR